MRTTWVVVAVALLVCLCGCGDDDAREEGDRNGTDRTSALEPDSGCSTGPIVRLSRKDCFESVVLDRSHERPVVVHFWARWSGPDRIYKPIVRQAVAARQGRVELVLVDVDDMLSIANRHDVRAVPTLVSFVDGRPVLRRMVGAFPRSEVERYLDQVEGAG